MKVIVRSELLAEHVAWNLEASREVYAELREIGPDNLRQATYQLDDEVTFIDLVELDDPGVMRQFPAFQRYRAALEERCAQPPQVTVPHEIDNYRLA